MKKGKLNNNMPTLFVKVFSYFFSYVANMGEAVIHHYRHCRKEWLKTSSTRFRLSEMYLFHMKHMTKCTDFRRSHSDVIGQLADTIKDDVFRRLEEIEL
jgi:hypothetical protein